MLNRTGKELSVQLIDKTQDAINAYLASSDETVLAFVPDTDKLIVVLVNPEAVQKDGEKESHERGEASPAPHGIGEKPTSPEAQLEQNDRKYEKAVFAHINDAKINGDVFAIWARQQFRVPSRKHLTPEKWQECLGLLKQEHIEARLKCGTEIVKLGLNFVEWEGWADGHLEKHLTEYTDEDWRELYRTLKDSQANSGENWSWDTFVEKHKRVEPMSAGQVQLIEFWKEALGWDEDLFTKNLIDRFGSAQLDTEKGEEVIKWLRKLGGVTALQSKKVTELVAKAGMQLDDKFLEAVKEKFGFDWLDDDITQTQGDRVIAWLEEEIRQQEDAPF